jgi:Protein of unknown function (DUF2934)
MVRPFTLRQLSLATNGLHVFSRISQMDQSLENRIRERAYEIWTANGCVEGQADQHWLAAEREILAAATIPLARNGAPQKKKKGRSPTPAKTSKALLKAKLASSA